MRFEELIENLHDEIFNYVWRLLHGSRCEMLQPEDIVQETFLRAYRNFSWLRSDSNHRAWLYKIATNCALDLFEAENRRDHEHGAGSRTGDVPPQRRVTRRAC